MIATNESDEARKLLPARIQKASLSRAGRLVLEVYTAGGKRWLVVDAGAVRLSEERPTRADDDDPPALQGLVRKELLPGMVMDVDTRAIQIARLDEKVRLLIVEPTRVVVCAVVDDGERILAVLGDAKSAGGRDLRRGKIYLAPPAGVGEAGGAGANANADGSIAPPSKPVRPPVDPALLDVRARVRAERKRLKRLVDALSGDLTKHADPAVHEENGELMKTVLTKIKRGQAAVDVVDWEGAPRTLVLDPALDAKDNLARFFKRAKKAREAIARTKPRLDEARGALARVDDVARTLASDPAPGASVDRVAIERAHQLLARPDSGGSARRRAATAGRRQPWRSFRCTGDVVVRVGRGAKDNDALVKSARGHDLWLHARNATGAHVVVPSTGADVEDALVLDAAHLAAHFSSLRTEPRVDVQHTRIKNVKKAGAPGLVLVSHESVLHLRVDAERTARLLAQEVAG